MSTVSCADDTAPTVWRGGHYQLLVLVILLKPFSNLALAWGMRHFPEALSVHPLSYLRAMVDPLVATGIGLQILWLLLRMSLFSVADLSFVLPVTAIGYVITTLLGRLVLHEHVSWERWLGTVLISLGTVFVVSTPENTTRARSVTG